MYYIIIIYHYYDHWPRCICLHLYMIKLYRLQELSNVNVNKTNFYNGLGSNLSDDYMFKRSMYIIVLCISANF